MNTQVKRGIIYVAGFALVGLVTLWLYYWVDIAVTRYFASWRIDHPQALAVFETITVLGQAEWFIVPALAVYLWWRRRAHALGSERITPLVLNQRLKYFLWVNVYAGALNWVLKWTFGRMRPKLLLNEGRYGFEWFETTAKMWSFPSGHTVTIVASATALAILFPRARWWIVLLAIPLAFSRVVVLAHFVSDVWFAAYLGAVVALLVYQQRRKKGLL